MPIDRSRRWIVVALVLIAGPAFAAQAVRLSADNWDTYAPGGKEVDAIYGDYVLVNDRIVAVIADPIPSRTCNVKVKEVGGCVIDLTRRDVQSDQLTVFFPGGRAEPKGWNIARRYAYGEPVVESRDGRAVLTVRSPGGLDAPSATVRYTLEDGWSWLLVETVFENTGSQTLQIPLVDDLLAERTFERGSAGDGSLEWVYDKWWQQAYGLVPANGKVRFVSESGKPSYYAYEPAAREAVTLKPGEKFTLTRRLICGPHALAVRDEAAQIAGRAKYMKQSVLAVVDPEGPVAGADVEVSVNGKPYASGRTDIEGRISFGTLPGTFDVQVSALARTGQTFKVQGATAANKTVTLDAPGYVVARITDEAGGPIPCKVQFLGRDGTAEPFFFPDCGEHAVHNAYYSHDGSFRQALGPGRYNVVISRGPEYDAVLKTIEVHRGSETPLAATLIRTVDTAGWVSTDFHSHSSPSGDNTSSQRGRVLNLLAEHVEFAPCTEHNRLDSYTPHLAALGVEHLMATAVGIELTGNPGSYNHQNAFPLIHKPRTQDGGGPRTDDDPVVQIERLALWDEGSEKLVQQNHPNIVQIAWDKDLDGRHDGGVAKMLPFMDAIEIHPPHMIFQPAAVDGDINKGTNRMHAWLQLINQGTYIPGVVNTDAHYNFHGSGWIRNYVPCTTDDPSKIQTLDIVRTTQAGHIIVTTGPFMTVSATVDGAAAHLPGQVLATGGREVSLHVRVQCPNWFDIDRVQVFINGRPDPAQNFTRAAHPQRFGDQVVKFDQTLTLRPQADAHIIIVAIGENSSLGAVMGSKAGEIKPIAVSNPIFLDVDGNGFIANGDTLDAPLPSRAASAPTPLLDARIALNDAAFADHDLAGGLERLRSLGFQSIETHHGGPTAYAYPHLGLDTADDAQKQRVRQLVAPLKHLSLHENDKTDWRHWIDGAAFIGARLVTVHQKPKLSLSEQEAYIRQVGDYAQQRGVKIAVENIGGPMSDYLDLIGRFAGHPSIGVCIDTGHVAFFDELKAITDDAGRAAAVNDALEQLVRTAGPRLWHVHLHNNRPSDKWRDHYGDLQGPIDFPRLIRNLHAIGYQGMLVLELHRQDESLDQKAAFGRYIHNLWLSGRRS